MSNSEDPDKLWGGRFTETTDAFVETFTASIDFDQRLAHFDIQGSKAHARMLKSVGVLTDAECHAIIDGLDAIQFDIERGDFKWTTGLEDVHMNIEARLTDRIGAAGKKLHTGRSRNDQVATDLRLYLRDAIDALNARLAALQGVLLDIAEGEAATIMPGFTHLQVAQPVTFGHHMMAWFAMLDRDRQRLEDCRKRVNVLPLGAAALAGTSYPIDRDFTARELGFSEIAANSLDAVSDRDFVIEFSAAASLVMIHLSRFSEELVIWSSAQFNFVELSDAFCTGSSIMPQKKNPDVPELVRGKCGRVVGHLVGLLVLMKSQALAYNKDNQEDKEPVFDTVDTLNRCLIAYTEMMRHIKINRDALYAAAQQGFSTATDLADYLVRNGVPFRDAHEIVGKTVRLAIDSGKALSELSLSELQQLSPAIREDVFEILSVEGSVAARKHFGGTAPERVRQAVAAARSRMRKRTDD
ncbi:MAG: argininosuccinate lyase [Gammaproteobacteria bacterium]